MFGAIVLIIFHRFKDYEKIIPLIAFVLTLSFASLSGDIIPFMNRYPMKKFANHIENENIKGPIAIYKLGNHRARLGILTGRTVITLHSPEEVEKFLKPNEENYLVIKKTDWEKTISRSKTKIVMTDQIGIKKRTYIKGINELLKFEKLVKNFYSAETIYFLRIG